MTNEEFIFQTLKKNEKEINLLRRKVHSSRNVGIFWFIVSMLEIPALGIIGGYYQWKNDNKEKKEE